MQKKFLFFKYKCGNISGLSLIEVLISIVILAIGITTILIAFRNIMQITKRSEEIFDLRQTISELYFNAFCDFENIDLTTINNFNIDKKSKFDIDVNATEYNIILPDETSLNQTISKVGKNCKISYEANNLSIFKTHSFHYYENEIQPA